MTKEGGRKPFELSGRQMIEAFKRWRRDATLVAGDRPTAAPIPHINFEAASLHQLMRYATSLDWCLLAVGVVSSVIVGSTLPTIELMFRDISNVMLAAEHDFQKGELDREAFQPNVMFYLSRVMVITLIMLLSSFVSVLCFHALCERQVHIIRCRLFRAIIRQSAAWFDQTEVGALTQKMNAGIEQMQAGLGDKCAFILQAISGIAFGVIVALTMSWRLTLVVILVMPFMLYTVFSADRASGNCARHEMGAYAAAGAVANEALGAIRTVTAFNAQNLEMNRYEKCLRKGRQRGISRAVSIALFTGLNMLIFFATNGIVFWYGIKLLYDYDRPLITPGVMFGLFWALMLGLVRLGDAIPHFGTVAAARLAAGEILAIIDEEEKIGGSEEVRRGLKPCVADGHIELCNVHFCYPTRPDIDVLNGLSFKVEPGESVALVGASGCGKSTIVSLLLRFYAPSGGSIRIDGTPIELLDVEWLRTSAIGVVAQEPVIFAATIEENMRLGKMDAKMEEIEDSCRQANAHDFIVKLPNGYQTLIGTGGVRLSGGQRQRLAIARALLRQPRILLLDEATSALDGESERLVQAALDKARHGRTTLTIAHRLSTIRNVDRIIVLERNGRIAECGTHDQLMSRDGGVYRQMAVAQHMDASERILLRKNLKDETETRSPASVSDVEDEMLTEEVHSDRALTTPSESNKNIEGTFKLRPFKAGLPLPDHPATHQKSKRKRLSLLAALYYLQRIEVVIVTVGVASAVLMGAAWPLFSLLYGRMFSALSVGDASLVAVAVRANALFYIAVGAMGAVTTFSSGALLSYVGETFSMRLRMAVFKNLLRQDSAFYDDTRHSVGKLTARLAVDARNIQAAIDQRLAGVIGAFVSLLLGMALGFYYGWQVACGGMAITIVLVFVELSVLRVLKSRGTVDIAVAEHSANIACEAIENVRTIQMLVREDYLCEMFETESKRSRQRGLLRALLQSITYAINYSFAQLVYCVCYVLGVSLVIRSIISPFTVFQVTEALISAGFAIMRCASYLPEYLRARLSSAKMTTLIAQSSYIDALGEGGRLEPIRGELEVQDVRFAYPTRHQHAVLDGLSFRATSGSTVALVGQSGCGKTTLIQLLERFYDVGGGSILIDGVDIREYNVAHLRDTIALVSQEPILFNLSVRENIAYGMRNDQRRRNSGHLSESVIMDAARMANVDEFVQRLPQKYDTLVGGKGAQLSGGQRQRIAIARAIARQPRILLLDEATSALDANSEKAVQEAMDTARVGRTCVVIAHRLSTIRNADLIVVMDSGRVAESGTHAELMSRGGHYARLVAAGSSVTDAAV